MPTQSTTPPPDPKDKPQSLSEEGLSQEQLRQLADAEKQAEYLKAFIAQERRRACPGCGEDGPF